MAGTPATTEPTSAERHVRVASTKFTKADSQNQTWVSVLWSELGTGWKTLLGSSLGVAVGIVAYPLYAMPVITLRLSENFGWGQVERSSISSAGILGIALGVPVAGWVADRIGVKLAALFSTAVIMMAIALAALSGGDLLHWQIGAFMMGFLGAGTVSVTYAKGVCAYFLRMRGLALGIVIGCASLFSLLFLPFIDAGIVEYGPRPALLATSALYLVLFLPLLWLLLPREEVRRAPSEAASHGSGEHIATSRPMLLAIGVAAFLFCGALTGAAASLATFVQEEGQVSATAIVSVLALGVIIVRPLSGILLDSFDAPKVTAVAFTLSAAGLLALGMLGAPFAIPGAILISLGVGAEVDAFAYLFSRYVTAQKYASAFGWVYAGMMLSGAIGPVAFAMVREDWGGFSAGFALCGAIALVPALFLFFAPSCRPLSSGT